MTKRRSEIFSAVHHSDKKPFDGSISGWSDFEAELRTAITATCGFRGTEYFFSHLPNDNFLTKQILEDLDDEEFIIKENFQGQQQFLRVTNTMRRQRKEENDQRREHNKALQELKQKVHAVLTSRISKELIKELLNFDGDLPVYWNHLRLQYGPTSEDSHEGDEGIHRPSDSIVSDDSSVPGDDHEAESMLQSISIGCPRVVAHMSEDEESNISESGSESPYLRRSREDNFISNQLVKAASRVGRTEKYSRPKACFDTGAMETCVASEDDLQKITHQTSDSSWKPKFRLESANGGKMKILAKGQINKFITDAYLVESLSQTLVSPKQLSKKGFWFIGMPEEISPDIGLLVLDPSGKVYMTCNRNYETDLGKCGSYDISINLPDVSHVIDQLSNIDFSAKATSKVSSKAPATLDGDSAFLAKSFSGSVSTNFALKNRFKADMYAKVNRVYGLPLEWGIKRLVQFVHDTYHVSKNDLCWMADHIPGFPVTSVQIKKHLEECKGCIAAHMRRRKVSNRNVEMPHAPDPLDSKPIKEEKSSRSPEGVDYYDMSKLDPRRETPGSHVSADIVGPYHGMYLTAFSDFASGYACNYYGGKAGKSLTADHVDEAADHFRKLKAPIGTLTTDSDSLFASKAVKKHAKKHDFKQRLSPPHQHEYNPQEAHNKVLKAGCIARQHMSPHMHELLWYNTWNHTTICNNLRPSKIPGDTERTRWEAVGNTPFNLNACPMMPYGQFVAIYLPDPLRSGYFHSHARFCAYLSYAPETPGGIACYDFKTRKRVVSASFKVLDAPPADAIAYKPRHFIMPSPGREDSEEDDRGPNTRFRARQAQEDEKLLAETMAEDGELIPGNPAADDAGGAAPGGAAPVGVASAPAAAGGAAPGARERSPRSTPAPAAARAPVVGVPRLGTPVLNPTPAMIPVPVSASEGVPSPTPAVPTPVATPPPVFIQEGAAPPVTQQPGPRRSPRLSGLASAKSVERADIEDQLNLALAAMFLQRAACGVDQLSNGSETVGFSDRNGVSSLEATAREQFQMELGAEKHNVQISSSASISPTLSQSVQQSVEKSNFWSDSVGLQLDQEMVDDQINLPTIQPTFKRSIFKRSKRTIPFVDSPEALRLQRLHYSESQQKAHRAKIMDILLNKSKVQAQRFLALCEKVNKRRMIKKIVKSYRKWDNPTWNQAIKRSDAKEWIEARRLEDEQMLEKGVFTDKNFSYSAIDQDSDLIGSMYICQIKRNKKTGNVEKYKVRLVALGNQQKRSSYDDIKSTNARLESVKLLMALKAKKGARHFTIDVKGAFLNATIPEDSKRKFFIRLPDGSIKRLLKFLYGMKQAGFEWQQLVTKDLLEAGFEQSYADPLIFSKWRKGDDAVNKEEGDFIVFSLHTDDFYGISNSESMEEELFSHLREKYGEVTIHRGKHLQYLGMVLEERDDGSLAVKMDAYYEKLCDMMPQLKGKTSRLPYASSMHMGEDGDDEVDNLEYLSYVGAVNFLSTRTRPNLLYGMSRLAQRCSHPTKCDMKRVEKMFKHINATMNQCIVFSPGGDLELFAYVDASHNCYDDGKGHYGFAIFLGENTAAFSTKSSKIRIVTQSSTESEYVAMNYVTREVVWARQLITDIGFQPKSSSTLYEDNESTILQATGHGRHEMTKHISPRYHYVREQISNGSIRVEHKPSSEMIADILTKPLDERLYSKFSRMLMNY